MVRRPAGRLFLVHGSMTNLAKERRLAIVGFKGQKRIWTFYSFRNGHLVL